MGRVNTLPENGLPPPAVCATLCLTFVWLQGRIAVHRSERTRKGGSLCTEMGKPPPLARKCLSYVVLWERRPLQVTPRHLGSGMRPGKLAGSPEWNQNFSRVVRWFVTGALREGMDVVYMTFPGNRF